MRKWKSKFSPIISIIDHQPVPLSVLSTKGFFPALLIPATHWPTTRTKEPREKATIQEKFVSKQKLDIPYHFQRNMYACTNTIFLQPYAKQYKQLRIQWKRRWELHFKCPTVKYEEHLIVLRKRQKCREIYRRNQFFFKIILLKENHLYNLFK